MNEFGRSEYGQPCRECGFSWNSSIEAAEIAIASTPTRMAKLLAGTDGRQRYGDAAWAASSYVWHVADNLRIWSERLADLALGGAGLVVPYDQDDLARVRSYEGLSMRAGLWALDRAAAEWRVARQAVLARPEAVLHHPEFGDQSLDEVVLQVAHDAEHHVFDVRRALEGSPGQTT